MCVSEEEQRRGKSGARAVVAGHECLSPSTPKKLSLIIVEREKEKTKKNVQRSKEKVSEIEKNRKKNEIKRELRIIFFSFV